jgi:predicted urease superfamily metal-dependent hydrolase
VHYEKNGLNVKVVFGIHPAPIATLVNGEAQMANYTLDQAMQVLAFKDGSLVAIGSLSRKTLFCADGLAKRSRWQN